jgi:hypothetical protein
MHRALVEGCRPLVHPCVDTAPEIARWSRVVFGRRRGVRHDAANGIELVGARGAVVQVRVDRRALGRAQLVVQVLRQMIRHMRVHMRLSRCPRISMRARWSCDFDVPAEMPSSVPIS